MHCENLKNIRALVDQVSTEQDMDGRPFRASDTIQTEAVGSHITLGSVGPRQDCMELIRSFSKRREIDLMVLTDAFNRYLYRRVPSLQHPGITAPREQHLPNLTGYRVSFIIALPQCEPII